jgi:hypothetical protein
VEYLNAGSKPILPGNQSKEFDLHSQSLNQVQTGNFNPGIGIGLGNDKAITGAANNHSCVEMAA